MGLNQVINIAKNVVKPFNKAGARLLTKETGVKFASGQEVFHNVRLPEGASSGSFVSGEIGFGKEGFSIVSFFNNKGELIDRRRFKIINGQTQAKSHSIYANMDVSKGRHNDKLLTVQKLVRRTTFDSENVTSECRNVFIDDMHTDAPKITRAITTYEPYGGDMYTEKIRGSLESDFPPIPTVSDRFTFSLEEFGKDIKHKLFKSKVDYSSTNGHFYTFKNPIETLNLTEQEIAQLSTDRYLPLKLHSGINRYKFLKQDVFENTGVHPKHPIEYEKSKGFGSPDGGYEPYCDEFKFTVGRNARIQIPFDRTIVTLAHEARHKYQYDLIFDRNGRIKTAEKLGNIKDLELAKRFSQYHSDKEVAELTGKYDYDKDGLEIDAFAWEKEYLQRFYQDKAPISEIFNKIGIQWLTA